MKTYQFQYFNSKKWQNLPDLNVVDSKQTLILAFCAPTFFDYPEAIRDLKNKFPLSTVVGCSTAGEIFDQQIFDLSISCTAIRFENSKISLAVKNIDDAKKSFNVGVDLANELKSNDLKGIILLSDGLVTNGSALVEGVNSIVDAKEVAVSGGLAGDGSNFKKTWVLVDGKIKSNCVLAVGLYGDHLQIMNATRGGWDIFGPERLITNSVENIVYEIDGRPALDLYKEYLGEKAKDLPASGLLFPIQIRNNLNENKRLVRTILAVDEIENSLIFAGSVPQGCLAQLMRANFDRVIDGAAAAAEEIQENLKLKTNEVTDSICIAISCVGRRLVLGNRSEEEVEVLKNGLNAKTALVGFYSYGELAPTKQGSPCDLHNQSMTLTQICEFKQHARRSAA